MTTLDVRAVPPAGRLEAILGAYEGLEVGETLGLTVDHDPECLYYTLLGSRGAEAFTFVHLERGPVVWRVSVTKRVDAPQLDPPWAADGARAPSLPV